MAGQMRPRTSRFPRSMWMPYRMFKGFYAPQKDNSTRAKKRARLNNYNEQKNK